MMGSGTLLQIPPFKIRSCTCTNSTRCWAPLLSFLCASFGCSSPLCAARVAICRTHEREGTFSPSKHHHGFSSLRSIQRYYSGRQMGWDWVRPRAGPPAAGERAGGGSRASVQFSAHAEAPACAEACRRAREQLSLEYKTLISSCIRTSSRRPRQQAGKGGWRRQSEHPHAGQHGRGAGEGLFRLAGSRYL
jgi:hypothetical protein